MKRVLSITTALLLLLFLLIGMGHYFTDQALTTETQKVKKKLLLTLTIRKKNIETYYGSVQAEALFWANSKLIHAALKPNTLATHTSASQTMQQLLNELTSNQGYDNMLLITPQGKLVYSVNPYISSLEKTALPIKPILQKIQQAAQEQQKNMVYFADYRNSTSPTSSPANAHAIIATGVFHQQQLMGILLIQLSTQPLTNMLKPMMNTHLDVQTLVVGRDKKLRNIITTMPHKISLPALTDALLAHGNQRVFTIPDQNNIPFLAAFDFAHIADDVTWVIISKTDLTQAIQQKKEQIYLWILLGMGLLMSALLIGYIGERWTRNKQPS